MSNQQSNKEEFVDEFFEKCGEWFKEFHPNNLKLMREYLNDLLQKEIARERENSIVLTRKQFEHMMSYDSDCGACRHEDHWDEHDGESGEYHCKFIKECEAKLSELKTKGGGE